MNPILAKIIDQIARHQRFLITSHIRPDGDAIGSELALYHLLCQRGKTATIYNEDAIPSNYRFLPGADAITETLGDTRRFDAAFLLDCSEIDRVGREAGPIGSIPILINIDHHVSKGPFCEIAWNDDQASSTGEMVYRLAVAMGADTNWDVAVNIYTAILTDTGSFRYANTGSETFSIAADLVARGVDPYAVAEQIYESVPVEKIQMLARALNTLEFHWQGRISSICVTKQMMQEVGASPEHTDNFADYIRAIQGVEVGVYYTELSPGRFKISLRSKGIINVERIASAFGGGGHERAAACRMEGDYEDIQEKINQAIMASGLL